MIILLGLQIFKVANQLLNGSTVDLGLQSLPIPIFDTFIQNYKTFSPNENKAYDSRGKYLNQTYFKKKIDSNNNLNDFSKRSGFMQTLTQSNQSIPFESKIRKSSKHTVLPKPYPYSRDTINRDQNVYSHPNSGPQRSDDQFSAYNIKPDWNQFEDSIDKSLNEPQSYYTNKPEIKKEEKREEDHTFANEDNDYNNEPESSPEDVTENGRGVRPESGTESEPESEPESGPESGPEDQPDLDMISESYDIDDDERDDEKEEADADSHKYKEDIIPECAFGHSYCHFDDEYPEASMRKAVDKQMDILTQILPDSSETFDLVEGISKEIDENYTYIDSPNDLYNSESSEQYSYRNENELNYRDGGYICPSYVNYIKPKRAQNNDGDWKVILNLNHSYRGIDYNQHIRIEECVYEKIKCSFAPNYYKSECIQKYSNERLLAWTPDKGIHLDVFRLPIACSCHITPNKK